MATFEIDEKRFEIIKEAVSYMRNSHFGLIQNWMHWLEKKSEGWLPVEIQSEILPHWDCRRFFSSVFFVAMGSPECLYCILWLKVTGPGIFFQSVFLTIDGGIAACFDRSRNLREGMAGWNLNFISCFTIWKGPSGI